MQTLSTGVPVAYPNVSFKPPNADGQLWIVVDHFPNSNRELVMSSGGTLYLGFIQARVYFRPNEGIVNAMTEAEAIIALFDKGTQLSFVRVESVPSIAPPVYDSDAGFIPVTIPYRGIA